MVQNKIIGVLGFPIAHSKSPLLFQNFFDMEGISDWEYHRFEYQNLSDFLIYITQNTHIVGFNITLPFKQSVLKHLRTIEPEAERIGAVNTVGIQRNSEGINLHGFNTDYHGFRFSLESLPHQPQSVVIIGTGGASNAVKTVLMDLSIPFLQVSRNPSHATHISFSQLQNQLQNPKTLLVNASPIGMKGFPQDIPELDFSNLASDLQIIDLIYHPEETVLLKKGRENRLFGLNGFPMLQQQAEKAWQIFKRFG